MPPQRRTRTIPCEQCKRKHLKCDGENPCASCRRAALECKPGNRSLRLKLFVAPDGKAGPRKRGEPANASDVRETTGAASGPGSSPSLVSGYCSPPDSRGRQATSEFGPGNSLIWISETDPSRYCPQLSIHRECDRVSKATEPQGSSVPEEEPSALDETPEDRERPLSSPSFSHISKRGGDALHLPSPSSPWHWEDIQSTENASDLLSLQESCLVRCFASKLAVHFDTTDRMCHFSTYLPMRALKNPFVLNAICGVASQYLLRTHSRQSSSRIVEFEGIKLPNLGEESVIRYQSACINLLMELSTEEYVDGDTLLAITLLRFHEQTDVPMTGSDSEVFQQTVQHIFETQLAQCYGQKEALPELFTPLPISRPNHQSASIVAFLVALRMEIWAVLLYERPMRLPLPSFKECLRFDNYDDEDDYLWTRRVLIWCAHILRLHFGSEGHKAGNEGYVHTTALWSALKAFEFDWDTKRPSCFQPLYSRGIDPSQGRSFPEIWLANPCQVMALQHIEFGRIILTRHEASLQSMRLGGGEIASQATEALFLHSTRVICGLTACHAHRHEALTAAAVAISMCGKYVHDAGERAAMMDIIDRLRSEFVWDISQAVDALKLGEDNSPHDR